MLSRRLVSNVNSWFWCIRGKKMICFELIVYRKLIRCCLFVRCLFGREECAFLFTELSSCMTETFTEVCSCFVFVLTEIFRVLFSSLFVHICVKKLPRDEWPPPAHQRQTGTHENSMYFS